MHSQLALTDHVSTNLAPLILLDPVLCRLPRQQQLSCICEPGQMEDLLCPSLSTHNTCTTSHKRTLHSRKSHQAPLLTLARRLVHDNANMESNIANFFYSRFPSSAAKVLRLHRSASAQQILLARWGFPPPLVHNIL